METSGLWITVTYIGMPTSADGKHDSEMFENFSIKQFCTLKSIATKLLLTAGKTT